MKRLVFAFAFIVSLFAAPALAPALECPTYASCAVDNDANPLNNNFEVAEDFGTLGSDQTGQPRTRVRLGLLGAVHGGFDSADYFKFRLPSNIFDVRITLRETPSATMWIMIYDQYRRELIRVDQGRWNQNENVVLTLGSGFYFVAVFTDSPTANGRRLEYELKIEPVIAALPNLGSADCRLAQSFTEVSSGRMFNGSLTAASPKITFPIFIRRGSKLIVATSVFPRIYNAALIDRPTGDQIALVYAGGPSFREIALDPGMFCLEISAGAVMSPPINFQFELSAPNMGFPPGARRENAPCLTMLDLGNLSRNGQYPNVRQPQAYNPNTPCSLDSGRHYVLREWVGAQQQEGWFSFILPRQQKIDVKMSNLFDRARIELRDQLGEILAISSSDGIPLSDQLPPQALSQVVPAGRYYLRVLYLGSRAEGTNIQVLMIPNEP